MPQLTPARILEPAAPEALAHLEIPKDLVHRSRRRVRLAALIGAGAYLAFVVSRPVRMANATPLERSAGLLNDIAGLTMCAGLAFATIWRRVDDRTVLALALAVEVLLSVSISLTAPVGEYVKTGTVPALTWVVPMIILVPVLLAAPPARTVPVALVCAMMPTAGLWLLASRGWIQVHSADYWRAATVGAVALGIAAVTARTIHSTGQQVAAARAFGSYELLEPLGRGGMGEVWKARHRLLARPAAVKFIRVERLRGNARARDAAQQQFFDEARMTAGLRSPHTVRLFDFGMSSTGTLYYAMELLEGLNLERFVYEHGPIEPRRAVDWLRQVCHSLAEAHALPLVHRDLKPANVFVCREGLDRDVVKVLDFGLAKFESAPIPGTAGKPVGTPSCMAPEVVAGGEADARSDLYAVGCIGYWLLAGRKPYEADSAEELMRLHVEAPVPSLAACDVPARLERILQSCLAKDPRERPGDATRLEAMLAEAFDGTPWTQSEARAWWATRTLEASSVARV